jgi:hypothetical protein
MGFSKPAGAEENGKVNANGANPLLQPGRMAPGGTALAGRLWAGPSATLAKNFSLLVGGVKMKIQAE